MKTISLSECEAVIINRPEDAKRRDAVTRLGASLGLPFHLMEAISCDPGRIGCGLSHVKALRGWSCERPLLLLEDDVAVRPEYRDVIEVPDDADALYLGNSRNGLIECFDWLPCTNSVIAEEGPGDLVRVHNMLAAHAIVHITKRWKDAVIEAMLEAVIDDGLYQDVGMAKIQSRFKVFSLRKPAFYQSEDLQAQEKQGRAAETSVTLDPWNLGTFLTVNTKGGSKRAQLALVDDRRTWLKA